MRKLEVLWDFSWKVLEVKLERDIQRTKTLVKMQAKSGTVPKRHLGGTPWPMAQPETPLSDSERRRDQTYTRRLGWVFRIASRRGGHGLFG